MLFSWDTVGSCLWQVLVHSNSKIQMNLHEQQPTFDDVNPIKSQRAPTKVKMYHPIIKYPMSLAAQHDTVTFAWKKGTKHLKMYLWV